MAVAVMIVTAFSCSSSRSSESPWTGAEGKAGKQLTATQQRMYNSLYTASVNAALADRMDDSYLLLEQALAVHPDAPEALFKLGMLVQKYGDAEGSLSAQRGDSLMRRAIELEPDNVEYLRNMALTQADKENFTEAVALYERAIGLKEDLDMLSELFGLYRVAGLNDKALEVLARIGQLDGADDKINLEKYKIYIERKDTAQAYAAIDEMIAANPGDPYYRALKANLYHEQGYNVKALELFQSVLAEDPKMTYARISLLSFYRTLSEDSLYHQLFDEILYDPDLEPDVRTNLMRQFYVDALQSKSDTAQILPVARQMLAFPQENRVLGELTLGYMSNMNCQRKDMVWVHERILEVEPDFNASRLEVLFSLSEKNDAAGIHRVCSEGRKYDAKQVAYYIYDAMALNELNRTDEAIVVLEEGDAKVDSTVEGVYRSEMVALLGDLYHEKGMTAKAYDAYEKAVKYDDTNLYCLNNYAYYLSKEKIELDKAESMSKMTIEAEPENATFLDTYAWILYQQERYTQARIYIDETLKYLDSSEDNSSLYDHAGDIYYRCDEVELAVAYWKKALKETDDEDLRKSLRKKIKYRKL